MRIEDLELDPVLVERNFEDLGLCKDLEFKHGMTNKTHVLLQISNVPVYQSQTGTVPRLNCLIQYLFFSVMSAPGPAPFYPDPIGPHNIDLILEGATPKGMSKEEMMINVHTYIQYGHVLRAICGRLGWGCLLYLADYFSDDLWVSRHL